MQAVIKFDGKYYKAEIVRESRKEIKAKFEVEGKNQFATFKKQKMYGKFDLINVDSFPDVGRIYLPKLMFGGNSLWDWAKLDEHLRTQKQANAHSELVNKRLKLANTFDELGLDVPLDKFAEFFDFDKETVLNA